MPKQFIGTKLIRAVAMTRAAYNDFRGWPLPADELGADDGYLVEYLDGGKPNTSTHAGYVSWSPKEQFDAAYRDCAAMTLGLAVEAMKRGEKVARAGWNGKGMFAYYVPANAYPAQTGAAKTHFGDGGMVPYNHYMALKGADDTVSTWAPSGSDTLAEDWQIVSESRAIALPPHQQRVIDERADLVGKLDKLHIFLETELFLSLDPAEQSRLHTQHEAMAIYADVLAERIVAFTA